ncbi:dispanin subfamily A member 2b-like [Syngnathoides biaculeatus]|uniref:dispanin subfamily A member 2b-like n=1 Tax=Syngnathoides biaculeatus TaxID=300417 RepID=UPI002ADE4573|nr:dispanin subfamily A member 2b-like [Syngnathoides biaculeatus]
MYPPADSSVAVPMQSVSAAGAPAAGPPVGETPRRPPDYIIYSICSFVYMLNPFCLGLAALVFSVRARDRKVLGDLEGARKLGSTAKCLNIAATVIFALFMCVIIVLFSLYIYIVTHLIH